MSPTLASGILVGIVKTMSSRMDGKQASKIGGENETLSEVYTKKREGRLVKR